MRALGIRVPVVLGSMLVVLALLFGAQLLYNRQAVDRPLRTLYARMTAVQAVHVQSTGQGLDIHVKLRLVQNLPETYQALQARTEKLLSGQHFTLQLTDNRTPQLVADYYQMDPIIMEGVSTGHFVAMVQRAQVLGHRLGLTKTQVLPVGHDVYVELVQGSGPDAHYLYKIVPFQTGATSQSGAATGGSGS